MFQSPACAKHRSERDRIDALPLAQVVQIFSFCVRLWTKSVCPLRGSPFVIKLLIGGWGYLWGPTSHSNTMHGIHALDPWIQSIYDWSTQYSKPHNTYALILVTYYVTSMSVYFLIFLSRKQLLRG